jgi:hypothetical protein
MEADHMTTANKALIDKVKQPKAPTFNLWQAAKGRDRSETGKAAQRGVNDAMRKTGDKLGPAVETSLGKGHGLCWLQMALKMGVTLDPLNLRVNRTDFDLNNVDENLAVLETEESRLPMMRVAYNIYGEWDRYLKAFAKEKKKTQRDLGLDICDVLDAFSGPFAVKNWPADNTNCVAAHFHACNVPLVGGISGTILEYVAFFAVHKPEALTYKSVLALMSVLTALGGHSLSEQIVPLQEMIKVLQGEGLENVDRSFLKDFLSIPAPLDMNRGCVATNATEAKETMPKFLTFMNTFIEQKFEVDMATRPNRLPWENGMENLSSWCSAS